MKRSSKSGFTLIEILAVLSIIIVIMGLTVGLVAVVNLKTTEAKAHKAVSVISNGLEKHRLDRGDYPADLRGGDGIIDSGDPMTMPDTLAPYLEELGGTFGVIVDDTGKPVGNGFTYRDAWGQEYLYINNPSNKFDYVAGSLGRDQKPGVEFVDDDQNGDVDDLLELGYGDDITNKQR